MAKYVCTGQNVNTKTIKTTAVSVLLGISTFRRVVNEFWLYLLWVDDVKL